MGRIPCFCDVFSAKRKNNTKTRFFLFLRIVIQYFKLLIVKKRGITMEIGGYMKTIKAQKLSKDAFSPYGQFFDFLNPTGFSLGSFFPDKALMPVSSGIPVGFSPLVVEKTAACIVEKSEYHNYAQEAILPIDCDILIHVAPASKQPVPQLTEAFIVPKGTLVVLRTGVWHLAPFPIDQEKAHILIGLPERTYMNDCIVVDYSKEDFMQIEI
jgi:ureidoglycolate lyase